MSFTTEDKLINVGTEYHNHVENGREYLVNLPALYHYHPKCKCRVTYYEWKNTWTVQGNGNIETRGFSPSGGANSLCINNYECEVLCDCVVDYTEMINKTANYNPESSIFGFTGVVLEGDVREYMKGSELTVERACWYLCLLGEYHNDLNKTIAFPWFVLRDGQKNNELKYKSKYPTIGINGYGGTKTINPRLSSLEKARGILSTPRNPRWNDLKFLYEQLLSKITYDNPKFKPQGFRQALIYRAALNEFRRLEHREPRVEII